LKLGRLSLLALSAIALLASAGGQQSAPPQPASAPANAQPALTIKSESRLVVVDVVVTDSHGQPV
jgi:hypothetical protein